MAKIVRLTKSGSKKTSIGRSRNSRPLSKHAKRNYKKYRGQGTP